jgi:hypothetical protein
MVLKNMSSEKCVNRISLGRTMFLDFVHRVLFLKHKCSTPSSEPFRIEQNNSLQFKYYDV